ncbi:MAG: ABC transporter permease [Candidatus Latescibacteria bacterium]|nr:ABC transporter permease [Candidatus Latescibacterota bacterium]
MGIRDVIPFLKFPFQSLFSPGKGAKTFRRFIDHIYDFGVESILLVVIVGFFVGLVTTVQSAYQISNMLPKYFLGLTVGRMLMIELGPVLTAMALIGRCVSAMAAEIGTMKVTEQIDALKSIKIDPKNYLAKPRILAMLVSLPLLNALMIAVSLCIGALYAQIFYGTNTQVFFYGLTHPFYPRDFWVSFVKSGFFAFWITTAGVYCGFNVSGGARDVGKAATDAVVISTVLVLVLDFVAATLFF